MDRGHCTDQYSWEWCKAHGYSNNRPVGYSVFVDLTQSELDCLNQFTKDELNAFGISLDLIKYATPTGSIIISAVATAYNAYKLWRCRFQ